MTEKSLFRAVAKQVHPDTQSSTASGDRMREAIKFKNDPDMLVRLARKWGLNIDGTFDEKAFNERSKEFAKRVFDAIVGAIIQHTVTYKKRPMVVRGVIVNKRRITRGHYKNATEFKVWSFIDGSIFVLKSFNEQPFDSIIGMADEDQLNRGVNRIKEIKEHKKAVAAVRQEIADNQFNKVGLKPNHNYFGSWRVFINYKGGPRWEVLNRTTAKCIYIASGRRMSIKFVLDSRRGIDAEI